MLLCVVLEREGSVITAFVQDATGAKVSERLHHALECTRLDLRIGVVGVEVVEAAGRRLPIAATFGGGIWRRALSIQQSPEFTGRLGRLTVQRGRPRR
jgi:hypothetical protein